MIRLGGAPGVGIFGPYVMLPAGRYEARIKFREGSVSGTARMDTAYGVDARPLGNRPVVATSLVESQARLKIVLDKDAINFEVRLLCEPGFIADIEAVEILQL